MRTSPRALFCLLGGLAGLAALPPAAAAQGGAARGRDPRTLAECRARILSCERELSALADRLDALAARYAGGEDAGELAGLDGRLRWDFAFRERQMDELKHGCRELMDLEDVRKGTAAFWRLLDRKPLGGAFDQYLGAALARKDFIGRVDVFESRVRASLLKEGDARGEAQARARRRRRWLRSLAAMLAAATALALGLPLLGSRRSPRPVAAPGPVAEPFSPGSALAAGYRIVGELGQGSMGTVHEAVELKTGRAVAIKRLREELHRSEKDVEHFLAQARPVTALEHPNLARLFCAFIEGGRVCLAMELVRGRALSRLLEEGEAMPLRSVKELFRSAGSALDYAHARGVVHGDLKPSNVLLGPGGEVKLMDFSLALFAKRILARLAWTPDARDAAFLAPEQELGSAVKESDVYSLGVVLHLLLAGRLPFPGPDFLGQKRAMRLESLGRTEADGLLREALEADPARRIPSAGELARRVLALPEDAAVNPRS